MKKRESRPLGDPRKPPEVNSCDFSGQIGSATSPRFSVAAASMESNGLILMMPLGISTRVTTYVWLSDPPVLGGVTWSTLRAQKGKGNCMNPAAQKNRKEENQKKMNMKMDMKNPKNQSPGLVAGPDPEVTFYCNKDTGSLEK